MKRLVRVVQRGAAATSMAVLLLLWGCGSDSGGGDAKEASPDEKGEEGSTETDLAETPGDLVADAADTFESPEVDKVPEVADEPEELAPVCDCAGKVCGLDNCGNSCGSCTGDWVCNAAGQCEPPPIPCDTKGFVAAVSSAKLHQEDSGLTFHFQGLSSENLPLDALVFDLDSQAAMGGPAGPGKYEAAFSNFWTGGKWLYMLKGWNGQGYKKLLVPIQGMINIEALAYEGGTFKAVLDGVVLQEASFNQNTMAVTVNGKGEMWCLDGLEMEAEISVTYPQCVKKGSGVFLGDNIADFKLQNCKGQWVSLHDLYCGKKAVWIVATAGW